MTVYTCPLHPEVERYRPDTCPRCGQKLVVREDERATTGRKPKDLPIRRGA